ncbi:MAG: hydrogenase 4 subunit D, partial [Devosia sp.]|nr:hydrogenase 4 subunit D [Devosia sp.]
MIFLATATILIPFLGAASIACFPHALGKWIAQIVAAATLGVMLVLVAVFAAGGKIPVEHTLISLGATEIFGLTIDRVSVLIALAVIAIGLLVAVYSAAYLNAGNREHPDTGRRRYYAFLLVFIGAMAGLV